MKKDLISKESQFGSRNYAPIPLVFTKAKGIYIWDTDGNKYTDFVSAYSAVSLGHSNKKIVKSLVEQVKQLGVTSRAFHNDKLPLMLEKLCTVSGFEKALPMNSGAEAIETALKIARKWGEKVKGIEKNQVEIIACKNNFHGRTLGAIALSTEPQYRDGFGPFMPGVKIVDFNNIAQLKKAITKNTAAFIVEPIQGEAGIITPSAGYLKEVRKICTQKDVLMIVDEIQTGLARTGKLFCFQHDDIIPDMVTVGKALGGGIYPVSAVLGSKEIMDVITPGDHGSTFGGNPIASAIAIKALDMLSDTKIINHVQDLGQYAMDYLKRNLSEYSIVKDIRGNGLFIGIEFVKEVPAKKIVNELMKERILSKDTHESVIRLAPPLIITKKQLKKCLKKIVQAINDVQIKNN